MGAKKKRENYEEGSLVGKRVQKHFKGFGKFSGKVTGYNASRGFYKVVYDDGDREELEAHEVEQLLVDSVESVSKRGRYVENDKASLRRPAGTSLKKKGAERGRRGPGGRCEIDTKPDDLELCEELGHRSRGRQPAQSIRNDAVKEGSTSPDGREEEERQIDGDVQQSSRRNDKRKRPEENKPFDEDSRLAKVKKNSKDYGHRPSRIQRGQKLLQSSDDDESDSDTEESSEFEVGSSDDDSQSSESSDMKDTFVVRTKVFEESELPVLLPLPASSRDFELSDEAVAEVFAIFSFLRSFSRALFLSPFCLDDFVRALIADTPNHLFDSIHLSLLQAVRRHLQRLLKDGSRVAESCLRQPNWNLLDIITWSSFLMVFLCTYGFSKMCGKHVHSLGLLDCEYYKVGVKTKLAALSFLCDQVMETDEIRAELDNRELLSTSQSRQKDRRKVTVHSTDAPEKVLPVLPADSQTLSKPEATPRSTGRLSTQSSATDLKASQAQVLQDWNSDECVLCGMDGNLICCDGCPAAYHSRCVGITRASLPPGDWFCPECIVEKVGGEQCKRTEGLRGAQLLGVDPFGRTFMSTCGYLLVLESSDEVRSSYKYYNKDDIAGVLENLEMLKPFCDKVSKAILQHWSIPARKAAVRDSQENVVDMDEFPVSTPCLEDQGIQLQNDLNAKDTLSPSLTLKSTAGSQSSTEAKASNSPITPSAVPESDTKELEGRKSNIVNGSLNKQSISHTADYDPFLSQRVNNRDEKGRFLTGGLREYSQPNQFYKFGSYTNLYLQGDTAATSAANLALMTVDETCLVESKGFKKKKTRATTTAEQLKAFFQAPVRFCWPSFKKKFMEIPKERCGWCFSCRNSYMKRGCLINQVATHLAAGAACVAGGIRPTKCGSGQLPAVAGYILHMEEKLHSLMLGPWENIFFRKLWRRKVEQATCVLEVKTALLELEANLRVVIFSEDWSKCLEDAPSLFLGGSSALATNEVLVRKRSSKKSVHRHGASRGRTSKSFGNALGTIQWWRRGKVAHRVFGWAMLPKKLARQAGCQGGLKRIMGLTYGEGEEIPKRSRQCAWRCRTESACTTAEIAVQVRCLDAQLRWDDLTSNVETLPIDKKSDQEVVVTEKPAIYAKSSEGGVCLYLVDSVLSSKQGLQQNLSSTLQGSKAAAQISGEKLWVNEFQVPLPLLTDYEEKDRLLRQSKSPKLALLQKQYINPRKVSRKDVFNFLAERAGVFSTARLLMSLMCKFCNLKVLASIAVQCQICKGPFHKDCTTVSNVREGHEPEHVCHGCLQTAVKQRSLDIKQQTVANCVLPESGQVTLDTVIKSCTRQEASSSHEGPNNGQFRVTLKAPRSCFLKQQLNADGELPKRGQPQVSSHTVGRSTQFCADKHEIALEKRVHLVCKEVSDSKSVQSQWSNQSNSLLGSGNPNLVNRKSEKNLPSDGVHWRRNGVQAKTLGQDKLLRPGQLNADFSAGPQCFLCQQSYKPELLYIRCEYCLLWFHGDAVGVTEENYSSVVLLKCHKCRKKSGPSCPHGMKHKNSRQSLPQTICQRQNGSRMTVSGEIMPRHSKEEIKDMPPLDRCEKQGVSTDSHVTCLPSTVKSEHPTVEMQIEYQSCYEQPKSIASSEDQGGVTRLLRAFETDGAAESETRGPFFSKVETQLMDCETQLRMAVETEDAAESESRSPFFSKVENLCLPEDCEQIKDASGHSEVTLMDGILSAEGSECLWNTKQYPRTTLSFMELLSSEDDRVEELAQSAMDFGHYWFEISDTGTFPDACGQNGSAFASGFETANSVQGCYVEQSQILDCGNQHIGCTSGSRAVQERLSKACVLCTDGSLAPAIQCIGCLLAVHQQCLEWSHAGVWTGHGWACDACKSGFMQGQDASANCMQLVDSRILLQS